MYVGLSSMALVPPPTYNDSSLSIPDVFCTASPKQLWPLTESAGTSEATVIKCAFTRTWIFPTARNSIAWNFVPRIGPPNNVLAGI